MQYLLAGSRTSLTYLQDRRALASIDWPAVLDDLIDAGAPPCACRWSDLDSLTHVVLATDRRSGRYVGLLGLAERSTSLEPYLRIEAAMVEPGEKGVTLRRAMLAHILARIVCLDGKPVALAAPRGDRSIEAALRDLGVNIKNSDLHPPVEGDVIAFRAACLGRRIGTFSTLLDLRQVPEASLLRELRNLHGARPERVKPHTGKVQPAMVKPARSAAATRRPRKATQTGRTV
jgi:hypothetical protein